MKRPFKYSIELQFRHPDIDPVRIATELNMKPSHSWKNGDLRVTPDGQKTGGIRKGSYANFRICEGYDGEFASALDFWVNNLESSAEFFRECRKSGGAIIFYIYWYPNGDTGEVLKPELLSRISNLGIELGINVYETTYSEAD